MWFESTHSILAGLVALMFSALLVAPCFCTTAVAQEVDDAGDESCCPERADQESTPSDEDSDDDCCCTGLSACGESDDFAVIGGADALISTFDDEEFVDGPTSWWTPDLVATLWLVDRLADIFDAAPASHDIPIHNVRPDRSDTYLTHATLLL